MVAASGLSGAHRDVALRSGRPGSHHHRSARRPVRRVPRPVDRRRHRLDRRGTSRHHRALGVTQCHGPASCSGTIRTESGGAGSRRRAPRASPRHAAMTFRAHCGLTAVLLLGARGALLCQTTDTRADSLLRDGAIGRAESLYYAAARARPRDPAARWQLGRYLISRGALRVGATLVEEAVRFGLDPRVGAATLAPVYLQVGEYHQLA